MKKSFKVALQSLSIIALLAFASNGFADIQAETQIIDEAPVVTTEAPTLAAKGKKKKNKKKGKGNKKHAKHDTADADGDGKPDAPAGKKKNNKHSAKDRQAHDARAVAHAEWEKNEHSLTSIAAKVTTEAPTSVAEIATMTSGTDRLVALFRFQEKAGKDLAEADKEAFEKILLEETGRVNIEFRQVHGLLNEIKDNEILDENESREAYKSLFSGVMSREHGKSASHRPMRKHDKDDGDKDDAKHGKKKDKGKGNKGKGKGKHKNKNNKEDADTAPVETGASDAAAGEK